jgi:hypothetical protein
MERESWWGPGRMIQRSGWSSSSEPGNENWGEVLEEGSGAYVQTTTLSGRRVTVHPCEVITCQNLKDARLDVRYVVLQYSAWNLRNPSWSLFDLRLESPIK